MQSALNFGARTSKFARSSRNSEVQLVWRRSGLMVIAPIFLWPGITSAEPVSPIIGRELAQTIQEAGYECREVQSIEVPTNAPSGSGSFGIQMALCSNGKKFLIARSGRDRGSARPVVRQLN
jgi:hypothetical protein